MKKTIAILFLVLMSSQSFAQAIPAGVYTELAKFPGLTEDYVRKLPKIINDQFLKRAEAYQKDIKSTCAPRIDVQYISNLTSPADSAAQDFESAFIGSDATFCFEGVSVEKVNREFQVASASTINSLYQKGDATCEKMTIPTLGNSHYCYVQQTTVQPGYTTSIFFNVWNDFVYNANVPVYFREVMASARQIGTVTEFHLQILYRGPKLNFWQKALAKGPIGEQQRSIYEKMKQGLQ